MTSQNLFTPAVRREAKLKMALVGAAGSGKTYTALMLADRLAKLAGSGRVAVIDTERGSAALYANLWPFDVMAMAPPYASHALVGAIQAAEKAGYDVLVIDSLSHFWAGTGGILEQVDQAARPGGKYGGNSRYAWAEGTPKHNAIIDAITGAQIHVIVTMRAKPVYIEEKVNGRTTYRKIGIEPVQRSGVDYEFSLVVTLDHDHSGTIDKGRFPELDGVTLNPPTADLADNLIGLLAGEPAPSDTERHLEEAARLGLAKQLDQWAETAHALEWVRPWFNEAADVAKWVTYTTKEKPVIWDLDTEDLLAALGAYTSALADGIAKKEAAQSVAARWEAGSFGPASAQDVIDEIPF